jgi:hypothetical protein
MNEDHDSATAPLLEGWHATRHQPDTNDSLVVSARLVHGVSRCEIRRTAFLAAQLSPVGDDHRGIATADQFDA